MTQYTRESRKQPAAPIGLSRELAQVLGSAIIDDIGESQLIDRIAAVTDDQAEQAAALQAWRDYTSGSAVIL